MIKVIVLSDEGIRQLPQEAQQAWAAAYQVYGEEPERYEKLARPALAAHLDNVRALLTEAGLVT